MAYLFMTDEAEHVDGTWEPDGGTKNAVILQPGSTLAKTRPLAEGPTLYRDGEEAFQKHLVPSTL